MSMNDYFSFAYEKVKMWKKYSKEYFENQPPLELNGIINVWPFF